MDFDLQAFWVWLNGWGVGALCWYLVLRSTDRANHRAYRGDERDQYRN